MELSILYFIQTFHNDILDKIMMYASAITDHGEIWILAGILMLCYKKTRKCGIAVLLSLLLALTIGNVFLKNLIARDRPCWIDENIALLIPSPSSYSFPSGHTFSSFSSAVTILLFSKKIGIPAVILASVIAFSRMYLFVHYPTDILAGIVLGIAVAMLSYRLINNILNKKGEAGKPKL